MHRVMLGMAVLAVLAGCGTAVPPSGSGAAVAGPTSTAAVQVERDLDPAAVVTAVRYSGHEGYDRVVVDLRGGVPGYSAEWVGELLQDASGKPLGGRGGAYLQVVLTPAGAHTDAGDPTWAGGPVYRAGLGNVSEVVRTGDFEGRVGVGLVLKHRAGYRITQQSGPDRLVIDVAH